jgi:hypothetical protein
MSPLWANSPSRSGTVEHRKQRSMCARKCQVCIVSIDGRYSEQCTAAKQVGGAMTHTDVNCAPDRHRFTIEGGYAHNTLLEFQMCVVLPYV